MLDNIVVVNSSSNITTIQPAFLNFLEWLSERPSSEYMSLFSGTRQAAEKETLIRQTICAMMSNFYEDRKLSSQIALHRDSSLAKNYTAFNWLVENKYFAVEGDRCSITQLAIAKLYLHFANKLDPQPLALPG